MDIEKKITITLSEHDVKEIVADYLSLKGYHVKPDNVTLVMATKWSGYGMGEHKVSYFKECTVTLKGD